MLNYYDPSLINYEYLPTFIRIGGIFKEEEDFNADNDALAIFLDKGVVLNSDKILISDCASTYSDTLNSCIAFSNY